MDIKRADWVTVKDFPMVGVVQRIARDGTWADVKWSTHTKRMPTSVLQVQHTIAMGDWEVTDETRRRELDQA